MTDTSDPTEHPPDDACPGSCNTAQRIAAREVAQIIAAGDTPPADLATVANTIQAGQPVWCRPCQTRIITAIGRLPDLAAALFERTILDDGRLAATATSEKVGKTPKRIVSPSGSPAWDAVDELVAWAGQVEDLLRAILHHAPSPHDYWTGTTVERARSLSGSVSYLTTWSSALLSAKPLGVDAGRRVLLLARRAEQAAGLDRLVHRLPAPCPNPKCGRKALVRDDGSEQVDCRACGSSWPESDYRRLTLILADEQRGKVPPPAPRKKLGTRQDGYGGAA